MFRLPPLPINSQIVFECHPSWDRSFGVDLLADDILELYAFFKKKKILKKIHTLGQDPLPGGGARLVELVNVSRVFRIQLNDYENSIINKQEVKLVVMRKRKVS